MSMQVSWNSQTAPVGYTKQKTAASGPASARSAAGQDQVTISPEARAAYKTGLYHITKQLTGYDMRELQTGDGHFYLPDGRELWPVLVEAAGNAGPQQAGDLDLSIYHHTYTYLGMRGWDGAPDAALSIDYMDGRLRDVPEEPAQPGDAEASEAPEETGSGYGLWLLADGKFHEAELPLTAERLIEISAEIRDGKEPLEPVTDK